MTKEDVLRYFDDINFAYNDCSKYDLLSNLLDELEQEPKPMEKFENVKDHIFKLAGDYKCWDNRLTQDEALELCHILDPESKAGHWIRHLDDLFPEESEQECSICHAMQSITIADDNYCPNCGAKMEWEG